MTSVWDPISAAPSTSTNCAKPPGNRPETVVVPCICQCVEPAYNAGIDGGQYCAFRHAAAGCRAAAHSGQAEFFAIHIRYRLGGGCAHQPDPAHALCRISPGGRNA